uniref:Uncharacterized protein n=1 Tax=Fagus sylvatica TaxID=28930 RepID=A0A2N9E4P6_FAGSY
MGEKLLVGEAGHVQYALGSLRCASELFARAPLLQHGFLTLVSSTSCKVPTACTCRVLISKEYEK